MVRVYAIGAGATGCVCNVLFNPLWVLRTRMQSEGFVNESSVYFRNRINYSGFYPLMHDKALPAKGRARSAAS